jgi:hypothetical protein
MDTLRCGVRAEALRGGEPLASPNLLRPALPENLNHNTVEQRWTV